VTSEEKLKFLCHVFEFESPDRGKEGGGERDGESQFRSRSGQKGAKVMKGER